MDHLLARVNLNLLRSFLAVGRHCSFIRAASELGRSKATLSLQVSELERQLGVRLLDRTTRRVGLTEAGIALLERLERGFAEIAIGLSTARNLSSDRRGRIVIACIPSLSGSRLPLILASYRDRDPMTRIDVEELTSSEVVTALLERRVDLGIGSCTVPPPAGISMAAAIEEPLCVIIPRKLGIPDGDRITLDNLSALPLITLSGSALMQTTLEDLMQAQNLRLSSRTEVRHVQTAVAMVRAGVGAAVVPRLALSDQFDRDIVILPIGAVPLTRTLGVLTRQGDPVSPLAMRFSRHVRTSLVKLLRTVTQADDPDQD